jgi:peroxiredoxin
MVLLLRPPACLVLACSLLAASGELSNRPAPDFSLPDSKGHTVSLADFKGKPLLIEFLSSTCPHCQKLAPVLESMHSRFKKRVGVVGIATYPDNATTVAQFVQTYKVTYPILFDASHSAAMGYLKPPPPNYSFSIPHLFVVDQDGYIRDDFVQNPSNAEFFTAEGLSHLVGGYLGRR